VPPALVDVPHPVNPGQHSLKATSNGRTGETVVTVVEGQSQTATIEMAPQAGAQPPATTAGAAIGTPAQDTGATSENKKKTFRIVSYVGFGVGVVGLGVGTVFALKYGSKESDANDLNDQCRSRGCTTAERDAIRSLDDDANSAGTIATIGLLTGGVGLATGVTFLVLSLGGEAKQAGDRPHVVPYLGMNRIGVTGTF
jgi:hypothetical protein